MAEDVLHHDDRIVHQDADGEDQREEGDAVQGVAIEVEREQRERERDRNCDQHDRRLAPAKRQPDQRRDREDREQHMPQQFVALVGRRLAIVAGDGEVYVRWHERSLERVELRGDAAGDIGGIGPFPFGDRQRDRRLRAGRLRLEGDIGRGLGVRVGHFRDIAHQHRASASGGHDSVADIVGSAQAAPCLEASDHTRCDRARCGVTNVGGRDRLLNRQRIDVVGRQLRGVDVDVHLPWAAADDRDLRYVVHLGDCISQLDRERSQLIVRVARRPHGDGKDRHIIDRPRLDDRSDDPGGMRSACAASF